MFNINNIVKKEVLSNPREILRDNFDERSNYLALDKNENFYPMTIEMFNELKNNITLDMLYSYPRLNTLYGKISKIMNVCEKQVYIGLGSDLAIKSLFDSCISVGDHIILHDPSYFMYEKYAEYAGAIVSKVPINNAWEPDIESILNAINDKTKLVIIEHPSGMVGTKLKNSAIEYLVSKLNERGILLLLDEAYLYVQNNKSNNVELLKYYKNIVLAYTLSKAHGLAGARVGFLISSVELIDYIARVRPLFEISALSAFVAEWQLDHPENLDNYQKSMVNCKEYLFLELTKLGFNYKDTHANFILINSDKINDNLLVNRLKLSNILVRRPFEQDILSGWIRVTVTGMKESKSFISVLKIIIKELK
jgi:histidinol-phosphate aminotransferase